MCQPRAAGASSSNKSQTAKFPKHFDADNVFFCASFRKKIRASLLMWHARIKEAFARAKIKGGCGLHQEGNGKSGLRPMRCRQPTLPSLPVPGPQISALNWQHHTKFLPRSLRSRSGETCAQALVRACVGACLRTCARVCVLTCTGVRAGMCRHEISRCADICAGTF